jgi:hypothetical protein
VGIEGGPAPARQVGPQRFLQPLAVVLFALGVLTVLAVAGDTLGYDFRAYLDAAHRLLDGQPLYDRTVDVAGGFAIYLYPPPFALAIAVLSRWPGLMDAVASGLGSAGGLSLPDPPR